jgi:hypothetical protein
MDTFPEFSLPGNNSPKVDLQHHTPVDPRGRRVETEFQSEYARYLKSSRWRALSRAVQMHAKGKCEICLRANGTECAHLTYDRVFNERITDLLWVCVRCHRELDYSLGFGH